MRKFREIIFSGGNKGFTLIELLVVIAVLGILAGIAVPRLTGVNEEAQIAEAKSALRNVQTGVEVYFAVENELPADLTTAGDSAKAVDEYVSLEGYTLGGEVSSNNINYTPAEGGDSYTLEVYTKSGNTLVKLDTSADPVFSETDL